MWHSNKRRESIPAAKPGKFYLARISIFGAKRKRMDSKEFIDVRKKLEKTQKDLASLLGISLKAVCSYEQGWRTIPSHVERQLIFLLAKKIQVNQEMVNCWEIRNCPEEKRSHCPAWEFSSGDFCWFISGTICDNTTYRTWEKKMEVCKKCVILQNLT